MVGRSSHATLLSSHYGDCLQCAHSRPSATRRSRLRPYPSRPCNRADRARREHSPKHNSIGPTSLAYYQLAYQMSIAPQSVYAGWTSPSTYWQLLETSANTYGNSEPVMASANSGAGADAAYQIASVPRCGPFRIPHPELARTAANRRLRGPAVISATRSSAVLEHTRHHARERNRA